MPMACGVLPSCLTAVPALLLLAGLAFAADAAPDWRWPETIEPACAPAGPERVLEAYMDDDRDPAGLLTWHDCAAAALDRPAVYVRVHLHFTKHFSALPDREITVDHQRLEWRNDGRLLRADAFSRGDAACGQLFGGECRMELRPAADGNWLFLQSDSHGSGQSLAVGGTAIDDFWNEAAMTAPELANLYTGRLWRMRPHAAPAADSVAGRPAQRVRIESESQGLPFFRARFSRVTWFAADGQVLRACHYQQDLGIGQMVEYVRRDLGVLPGHDCAQWLR